MDPITDKTEILTALQEGNFDLQGQFILGSNYTFLVQVDHDSMSFQAVYKPSRGEMPLWDFPAHTLAKREVAAFEVSEGLGWELVPPTIYRRKGPLGPGSMQFFIPHDPQFHYFTFTESEKQRLRPVAVFDLLVNNADRKGGHILRDQTDNLWFIDHGICFNIENKLRTVIWDFAGEPIPEGLLSSVKTLLGRLEDKQDTLSLSLRPLLNKAEISMLARRARNLLENPVFPIADSSRRYYPWPPI